MLRPADVFASARSAEAARYRVTSSSTSAPERRRARLSSSRRAHSSRRAAVSASRSMRFTVAMPAEQPAIVDIHQDEVLTGEAVMPILTIVLLVLVMVVIPTVVETTSHGRSLGKLAVGGRIVRADGGASGFRHAFIRALVGVFELWFTVGAVAALVGAFTPRSQRLGDLLAGTYSERTRTPRLPDVSFGIPPVLADWAGVADVARLPEPLSRRLAQFARSATSMQPTARARTAASLARETADYVSPVPAADPETFLIGVVALRRERELRALQLETARVDALTAP